MRRRKRGQDEGWLISYADLITNLLIFFVMLLSASSLSKVKFQEMAKKVSGKEDPQSLTAIQKEINEKIKQEGLGESVSTKMTPNGLEVSLNSGVVFDTGSAIIRQEWESILGKVLEKLVPYSTKYTFAVEGHTDSTPISSGTQKFYSNWELSSARAMEVRRKLETVGIAPPKIRVEAYADTKPLPPEDLQGLSPENRLARHRRVIVRIF